jgi:hypothetical protein
MPETKTDPVNKAHTIVVAHARMMKNGQPGRCRPKREDHGPGPRRAKVIYPDRESALAAVEAFEALDGKPGSLAAYPCLQSRTGHYHITSCRYDAEVTDA